MCVQIKRDAVFSLFSYFSNTKKNEGYFLVYSATFLQCEKFMFKTITCNLEKCVQIKGGGYFLVYSATFLQWEKCMFKTSTCNLETCVQIKGGCFLVYSATFVIEKHVFKPSWGLLFSLFG